MQAVAARFNTWQRNALCLAGVVIVGMIAYPPWFCEPRGTAGEQPTSGETRETGASECRPS